MNAKPIALVTLAGPLLARLRRAARITGVQLETVVRISLLSACADMERYAKRKRKPARPVKAQARRGRRVRK